MKHLFGTGSHPLTGASLGAAYKIYDNSDIDGFNREVARRLADLTAATGRPKEMQSSPPSSPASDPRWRGSTSSRSTGGNRRMLGNCPTRSPATPGHDRPQSPDTTCKHRPRVMAKVDRFHLT